VSRRFDALEVKGTHVVGVLEHVAELLGEEVQFFVTEGQSGQARHAGDVGTL
jgi:hypothetical protein